MGDTLFIEIGTEEIPAGYIAPALEAMSAQMTRFLDENRIAHGEPHTAGTPRRLVLNIPDVAPSQESVRIEITGPPRQAAYDAQGNPTRAAEGFAKGQGVRVEDLTIKQTPKGEYLCVYRQETGSPTRDLLEKMLPDFIARIPFPKSMHWGSFAVNFARPVRWIVALFGTATLDVEYGGIKSGNKSMGHRFMSPEWLEVRDYESHRENLRKNFVVLDIAQRRKMIADGVGSAARGVGGNILEDDELLDEVNQLVEFPQPLVGRFEEKYLELPPELLITVIKKHQRYFAITEENGRLLPYFVTVSNTIPKDFGLVAAGNARVVRARLEDARFYYKEDQKVRLDERVEQLKGVVFHSRIGTSFEKLERFSALARYLSTRIAPDRLDDVLRATWLCKADLVSGVVGEFPELQGVMGKTYAKLQGESDAVANAVFEHYLPIRAGGPIPESIEGALISIADKIDTIAACFGVGMPPTGTADPFALRRQTLGIIRIFLETPLRVSLGDLVQRALALLSTRLSQPAETVKNEIMDFFKGRLHHLLLSREGFGPDIIEAALGAGMDDLVEAVDRTKALAAFTGRPDFNSLAAAIKRVANIIKEPETAPVDPALFHNAAEGALFDALRTAESEVGELLPKSGYAEALESMGRLKGPIDGFFDSVLVMDSDESVRRNRLALLTQIHALFSKIADFRKIQTA